LELHYGAITVPIVVVPSCGGIGTTHQFFFILWSRRLILECLVSTMENVKIYIHILLLLRCVCISLPTDVLSSRFESEIQRTSATANIVIRWWCYVYFRHINSFPLSEPTRDDRILFSRLMFKRTCKRRY